LGQGGQGLRDLWGEDGLKEGPLTAVGSKVGEAVGESVGAADGASVSSANIFTSPPTGVGAGVGLPEGANVGACKPTSDGLAPCATKVGEAAYGRGGVCR
jgi:hypothetical protein